MDQEELVDFDPNQERRRHYNGEAHADDGPHPRGGVQCQTSQCGQGITLTVGISYTVVSE